MYHGQESISFRTPLKMLCSFLLLLPILMASSNYCDHSGGCKRRYGPVVVVVAAENRTPKPQSMKRRYLHTTHNSIGCRPNHYTNNPKIINETGGRSFLQQHQRRRQSTFQQQTRRGVVLSSSPTAFQSPSLSLLRNCNQQHHHRIIHHHHLRHTTTAPSPLWYSPSPLSLITRSSRTTAAAVGSSPPPLQATSDTTPNEDDVQGNGGLDMDKLMDMDIVLFSQKEQDTKDDLKDDDDDDDVNQMTNLPFQLGAIQEDGTLAPLSAWTLEEAFTDPNGCETIEFVVDEDDRWQSRLEPANVVVHSLLDTDVISYGSRQVGGGKGPGNPHGEESELLYYVERNALDEMGVEVVVKPKLEILW